MYDIITVGSATVDVFAKTDAEQICVKYGKHEETHIAYPSGSKILITELHTFTGGGGTNTAVSFARMGLSTAFLGKVGKDLNSEIILKELKKENVAFIGARSSAQTGYSVILDSKLEDRTILTYKGCNNDLRFDEVKKAALNTKWFYFSSMVGEAYKVQEKIAAYAKARKIPLAFNPSSYIAKQGPKFLSKILRCTHIIILNKEEAEIIVGPGDIKALLGKLRSLGPKIAVITDGKNGAYASDGVYHSIKPRKVKIRETTGAGDAFASGLVASLAKGNSLKFSMEIGMVNASSVIQFLGAKNRLLTYKEAMKLI
jgi:ribokinase